MKLFSVVMFILVTHGICHAFDFSSRQKALVVQLYLQKNYFQCIAETRRLLAYKKDLPHNSEFNFFIEANYFLGKQYKTVVAHLYNKKNDPRSNILLAQSLFKLGYHYKAFNIMNTIPYPSLPGKDRFTLFFRKADIFLHRRAYAGLVDEIGSFKKLALSNTNDNKLEDFHNELLSYKNLSIKSPAAAMMLSVFIPGAGQIYSGRYSAGLLSFISVFGTAYAAYYFRDRKQLSATLVFFSSVFYLGNVYGAYNSAANHNKYSYDSFNNKLRTTYIPEYQPVDNVEFLK